MERHLVRTSKFLSLVLRHDPGRIGLTLDAAGWASVPELLRLAGEAGHPLTPELLEEVVARNDKQRFSLEPDGLRIRANQGHSIPVDLGLEPVIPPEILYHGTATRTLDPILEQGLTPGTRQHVHLSPDEPTAVKVGQRHGKPVVLRIRALSMHEAGHTFFLSVNGVWLTAEVPPEFIDSEMEYGISVKLK